VCHAFAETVRITARSHGLPYGKPWHADAWNHVCYAFAETVRKTARSHGLPYGKPWHTSTGMSVVFLKAPTHDAKVFRTLRSAPAAWAIWDRRDPAGT